MLVPHSADEIPLDWYEEAIGKCCSFAVPNIHGVSLAIGFGDPIVCKVMVRFSVESGYRCLLTFHFV